MKKILFKKIDSLRDWKIITWLFALGLILLSLFAWNVYLSSQIGGGYFGMVSDQSETATPTIDQKRLQADLKILEARQADLVRTKAGQTKLIDPSL